MTVVKRKTGRRRHSRKKQLLVYFITAFFTLYIISWLWFHSLLPTPHPPHPFPHPHMKNLHPHIHPHPRTHPTTSQNTEFTPTLRGKKILIEITTVGQFQYSYFEHVLDNFRDLCETGAHVSLHITTSNCDPNPRESDPPCPLYERSVVDSTLENNYSVEKIDQLNERLRCRDPDGKLEVSVHLLSPDWGKQVVDHHRKVFYDRMDEGYDVFVHSEEDETIRPTNILAFMDEIHKLRLKVGTERLADYNIGFVRYENQMHRSDRRRVVWEFEWEDEIDNTIDHPDIQGEYFSTPGSHHQGMYMAVRDQLMAWKTRGPECLFDKPVRRYGYHRERVSGAMDLYDEEFCNVTQLIPLDSMEDLYVHHMPDKNYVRQPQQIIATMDLHKRRMKKIMDGDRYKKLWVDENGEYDGIQMFVDERNSTLSLPYDLDLYEKYVARGGMLSDEELKEWDWEEEQEEA